MKAIVSRHYGPLEALTVSELPRPNPQRHQVLVHVHAAALHIGDVFAVRGSPLPVWMSSGLVRPNYGVPGCDLAGLVLAAVSGMKRCAQAMPCSARARDRTGVHARRRSGRSREVERGHGCGKIVVRV
jgi:NADPH:quinone reductase-like Zn-dependent oxidoreductase